MRHFSPGLQCLWFLLLLSESYNTITVPAVAHNIEECQNQKSIKHHCIMLLPFTHAVFESEAQ